MDYVTVRSRELLEQRERHRRLLTGVPASWLNGKSNPEPPPLPPSDEIAAREAEISLREVAEQALANGLVAKVLEPSLSRDAHAIALRTVRNLESVHNPNLTRCAEVLETPIDNARRKALDAIPDFANLDDGTKLAMQTFVAAAVAADVLAGDYLDPRVGVA